LIASPRHAFFGPSLFGRSFISSTTAWWSTSRSAVSPSFCLAKRSAYISCGLRGAGGRYCPLPHAGWPESVQAKPTFYKPRLPVTNRVSSIRCIYKRIDCGLSGGNHPPCTWAVQLCTRFAKEARGELPAQGTKPLSVSKTVKRLEFV